MMCYKDMTFCSKWETCKDSTTCGRALTKEVEEAAERWWGKPGAPIAMSDGFDCYVPVKEKEENE